MFLLFIYLFIVALLTHYNRKWDKLFKINFILLVLFFGLRGYDIGSRDTLNYINYFLGKVSTYAEMETFGYMEYGFVTFNSILRTIFITGWQYLLIVDCISLMPLYVLIKKYSSNKNLSLLLFFVILDLYIVYLVCTRQILAMSFILWGIIFILDKKPKSYIYFLILSIIAYSIHGATIVMAITFIALYFIIKQIPRKIFITCILTSFIVGVTNIFNSFEGIALFFQINNLNGNKHLGYLTQDFNDVIPLLVPTINTFIGLLIYLWWKKDAYDTIFEKMLFCGIIIGNLFPSFLQMYRFIALYTIFGLVLLPNLFTEIFQNRQNYHLKKTTQKLCRIIIILLFLRSFYNLYYVNTEMSISGKNTNLSTNPYVFFWEDKYNY